MKHVLVLFITFKLIILGVIFFTYSFLPYHEINYTKNFIYPPGEKHSLVSAYKSWDSQHYLFLADKGYRKNQMSNEFYPLLPLFISALSFLTGNKFLVGMIVSNVFSFGAVYFLFNFLKERYGTDLAEKSTTLLLVFPTAFYLSLIYSESIFLFFVLGSLHYLYKRNYLMAGIFSFFVPLTRPVGMFFFLPLLIYVICDKTKSYKEFLLPSFNKKIAIRFSLSYLYLIFFLTGAFCYFLAMYIFTGNMFAGLTAAATFPSQPSIINLFLPHIFLSLLFSPHLSLHGFHYSSLDRLFFILFLVSLFFMYKKFDKTHFAYAITLGMVPLFGTFVGYMRYVMPVFPIYILLGMIFSSKRYSFLYMPFMFLSFSLQVFLVVLYSLNYWVS